MLAGHVYILGSSTGTLYIGVTSDLDLRIAQHKSRLHPGFAAKYNCHRLLYSETFVDIREAIAREKQLKGWTRAKKVNLIAKANPTFKDLAEQWGWRFIGPNQSTNDR